MLGKQTACCDCLCVSLHPPSSARQHQQTEYQYALSTPCCVTTSLSFFLWFTDWLINSFFLYWLVGFIYSLHPFLQLFTHCVFSLLLDICRRQFLRKRAEKLTLFNNEICFILVSLLSGLKRKTKKEKNHRTKMNKLLPICCATTTVLPTVKQQTWLPLITPQSLHLQDAPGDLISLR